MVHRRSDIEVEDTTCGDSTSSTDLPLRIASIFVILVGASFGALFPVLSRRTKFLRSRIPKGVFDTAKYFGSGVIIATAFIHLLSPAIEELGSPCLSPAWHEYPYALGLALISIFTIFLVELVAMRWGTAKLAALGISHDHSHSPHSPHSHEHSHSPEDLEAPPSVGGAAETEVVKDLPYCDATNQAASHLVGIAILEFGVLLHSFLIGLTLAVTENFRVLFVVLVFHQTFEGLGVGSRLAYLSLSSSSSTTPSNLPIWAALAFGITTPIGIAIGLGVRESYNPGSASASIVSGVLDAVSAGILVYTGLVELLAHDFLFNPAMMQDASNAEVAYAVGSVMLGCGLMALLGRWA
ncbi:Zinc/iron permease [Irpex lacteus]|nr:Zinc/iron permease [Irpex lacteus]